MTSGLFDTGFAGDAADVASLDFGVSDVDQSLFSYQDGPSSYSAPDAMPDQKPLVGLNEPTVVVEPAAQPELSEAFDLDSWSLDMLDPLADLDDPLGDTSLDAFVDLDSFFMGATSTDHGDLQQQLQQLRHPHMTQQPVVEVKPVINFDALDLPSVITTDNFLETSMSSAEAVADIKSTVKGKGTSRKRKMVPAVETSMFKVPAVMLEESQYDHDYVPTQTQQQDLTYEAVETNTVMKRQRFSSTASMNSEVSSTSGDFEEVEVKNLDKTTIRRIKNNIASKRSRQQKKTMLVAMEEESEQLIVKNAQLKIKIVELEQMAKDMKQQLIAKMAGCT